MAELIGLSGKAGTGKTTLAELIVHHGSKNWTIMNFADVLKIEVSKVFNFPLYHCYTEEGKNLKVNGGIATVRDILQWYGTDIVRKKNPGYWTNIIKQQLKNTVLDVILADMRFPDEADLVRSCGGRNIRIQEYDTYCVDGNHESETALDHYCFNKTVTPGFGELKDCAMNLIEVMGL